MSSNSKGATTLWSGAKIALAFGLVLLTMAAWPTGSIMCERNDQGLCDLSKTATKRSILQRIVGGIVGRQDIPIDPSQVGTMQGLFDVASLETKDMQVLPIDDQSASKLAALLYSGESLTQKISLTIPVHFDEPQEFFRRVPTRRVPSRTKASGYEYVIWHGRSASGEMTAQITASEHEGRPYLAIQVTSNEGHYILYRMGNSSNYRIVRRINGQNDPPARVGGSLPSEEDLCDDNPPNYARQSPHGTIMALVILPEEEQNFWRTHFEEFLAKSVESVGSDAPLVELHYETYSTLGLPDFEDDDFSMLENATARARNASTDARARDILSKLDIYTKIRTVRDNMGADVVLVLSPHIMTSQSSSFGADDARFFALLASDSLAYPAVVTHELSHLFGARHQIYNDPSLPASNHAFAWRSGELLLGTADSAPPPDTLLRVPIFSGSASSCNNHPIPSDVQDHMLTERVNGKLKKITKNAWDNSSIILSTMKRISSGELRHASLPEHCPTISYPFSSDEQRCPDVDGIPFYFNLGRDSYVDEDDANKHLGAVARIVRACGRSSSDMTVTSSGFASSDGGTEKNWDLSYQRAVKVAKDIATHFEESERPRILACPYGTLHASCYENGSGGQRERARLSIVTITGTASCRNSVTAISSPLLLKREW